MPRPKPKNVGATTIVWLRAIGWTGIRAVSAFRSLLGRLGQLLLFVAVGGATLSASEPYQPVYGDPLLEPWRWQTFQELRGLDVQCMVEGPDGTIWFGTGDGLASYDGIKWKRELADNNAFIGWVAAICFETDGSLIAGGWWGLSRFRDGRWERLFPAIGMRAPDVRDLVIASDGAIWAATSWGALRWQAGNWTLFTDVDTATALRDAKDYPGLRIELLPDAVLEKPRPGALARKRSDLYDACTDEQGAIWFGTKGGEVLRHAGSSWSLFNEADGLASGRLASLLPRRDGSLWVAHGSADALSVHDGTRWRTLPIPTTTGTDSGRLLETRDGVLWLSSRYMLLSFVDGVWRKYEQPEIPLPIATNHITQSMDGALWIAGANTEVKRVDYQTRRWLTLHDLNFQWESPAGVQWFLHRSGRIVARDRDTWISYGVEDGLIDTPVALLGTRDGAVWAAGSHGPTAATARFDGHTWIRHLHDKLSYAIDWRAVFESRDGSLWFGAAVDSSGPSEHRNGLLQYRNGTWRHHHQPGRSPHPDGTEVPATLLPPSHRQEPIEKYASFGEARDGTIWTGRNVLAYYDGKQWTEQHGKPDLRFGIIESMFTTREGDLWIGTRQYGAVRYDGHAWRQYQDKDTLEANSVRSLAQTTDGSVWAATDRGASRFDGVTWTPDVLPSQLTLPHEGGNLKSAASGALWINFHTVEWNRRAWSKSPRPATDAQFRTVLHQFQGTPPQTTIAAGPEKVSQPGNLSVLWHGVSPWRETGGSRLQFSFRLDDQPWSPYTAEGGHAFFALPHGPHRLEVRARDHDFNVDPTPASLEFVVLPPAWRQTWFVVLMILLGGLIATQTIRVFLERGRLRRTNRALATEIDARRRAAEEIRLLNASLEKRVEERTEALSKSEERYRLLFDTMRQGVVHQDTSGRVIFMNPAAERILGKSREEFLGQTPASVEHDTFHEDGTAFPGREHPASAALQTGLEVRDVVMGVRHPHEPRLRWINITATPLFRAGEATPYEVYTIFDDITARREADLQVRSLNAQLDARAQALESTNRELESFSYSVSHDLRAPLRSIDGFSRALLEDYATRLDDEGRDFLNRICGASQRMGQLIDDLLHLSQVTRNEMRLGPVDFSGLAYTVADTLRQAHPERRIEFDIATGLQAYADARLLQLVLENLFGNAVKFSSRRPVAHIQFGRAERNGGPAFFVRDNGAGFEPAKAVKLFGAFQRFHTAAEFPGTGIGLATVQRIIHRHGGRLEVESRPDQGATFFFTLPEQPSPSS